MTSETGTGDRRRQLAPLLTAASRVGELLVLALLLMIDFELGTRLLIGDPGAADIAGALATALVAMLAAVLAIARRHLPARVTVTAAFALSVLASAIGAATATLSLSLTEIAALMVLTAFAVRSETSARGAAVVGAMALVVALAAVLLRVGVDAAAILLALLVWVCALIGGVAGRYVRMSRERAMAAHQQAERMELARELHDVVAHQVSGIVVQAQAAIAVAGTDPQRAAEAFSAIESAGTEALSGMRRMVGAIRDDAGQPDPLAVPYELADIPALVERFDPAGERTRLDLEVRNAPMPPGVGETAYRVVREALTNVRRHAPDGTAQVSVRVVRTQLVLAVSNDGVRAHPVRTGTKGFGLTGLAERVGALGGSMRAEADGPNSWRVDVTLPLERIR